MQLIGGDWREMQTVETDSFNPNSKEYQDWFDDILPMFCRCEFKTEWYFVGDNESDEIDKHHFRCEVCHKITQVG